VPIPKPLGQSSIKITIDRCGQLLPSLHEAAMRDLEISLVAEPADPTTPGG
jgi:hypothetical protein